MFVELPLFVKTIEKAKDGHFFHSLLKENVTFIVVFEFFLNFWSFSLGIELVLVPIVVIVSFLYVLSGREKKYERVNNLFNLLFAIAGLALIGYSIYSTIVSPQEFFKIDTLKSFLLPFILLVLNLPVVYGLALYNMYEQIIIRLKGEKKEKRKMKCRLFRFAGIDLYKVTAIRKSISQIILTSFTDNDLKNNLENLQKRLSLQIGDNYMKRPRFYIISCIIGLIISIVGIILLTSTSSVKDILTFNFEFDILLFKKILSYVLSSTLVLSIFMLVFAIGFGKKKNEEITQIKKYALFELLTNLKKQEAFLQDFPPIDDPAVLFTSYVIFAYDINDSCDKVLSAYENLLKTWEKESVESLHMSALAVVNDIGIAYDELLKYDVNSFVKYYNDKIKTSPQNDDFNFITNTLQRDIKKYTEQVKMRCVEFKSYF